MYPDLVICGAPRCGTTSLYTYLGAHPDVGITRVKETHFFLGADHPLALPVHCDKRMFAKFKSDLLTLCFMATVL